MSLAGFVITASSCTQVSNLPHRISHTHLDIIALRAFRIRVLLDWVFPIGSFLIVNHCPEYRWVAACQAMAGSDEDNDECKVA